MRLRDALGGRSVAFAAVVKAGRTHLTDASPITLGQEFGGYCAQVTEAIERLEQTCVRVAAVPLGGTATGNGLNAPIGAAELAITALARTTGLPLRRAADRFAAQGGQDALVELSGQLRAAAVGMFKIANDIRLLGSGPRTGLAEIRLPALQPGSSIMPGKVNPVLCEVVTQVVAQVIGNDAAVAFAGTQGTLELNTYLPLMAVNLLDSVALLGRAAADFATRCVDGIEADVARCRYFAEQTPSVATALNLVIGYDAAAMIVEQAVAEQRSIRSVLLEQGALDADRIDSILDLDAMAAGSVVDPPNSISDGG
jgi:fumarate hydratase class II